MAFPEPTTPRRLPHPLPACLPACSSVYSVNRNRHLLWCYVAIFSSINIPQLFNIYFTQVVLCNVHLLTSFIFTCRWINVGLMKYVCNVYMYVYFIHNSLFVEYLWMCICCWFEFIETILFITEHKLCGYLIIISSTVCIIVKTSKMCNSNPSFLWFREHMCIDFRSCILLYHSCQSFIHVVWMTGDHMTYTWFLHISLPHFPCFVSDQFFTCISFTFSCFSLFWKECCHFSWELLQLHPLNKI
jgi:hypothetical protein